MMAMLPASLAAQVPSPSPNRVASAPQPSTIPVDRVVAVVGDQVILWSDVMNSIHQQRAAG
jgi:hypothetical protein